MPTIWQIVLSLPNSWLDMGYCITTDKYYTLPQLADFLVYRNTSLFGSLHSNHKDLSRYNTNQKTKQRELT